MCERGGEGKVLVVGGHENSSRAWKETGRDRRIKKVDTLQNWAVE